MEHGAGHHGYIMSLFGTFLTRSGVVNSVHAFAQSPIGGYFAAFIVVALSASFYLLLTAAVFEERKPDGIDGFA